MALTIAAISAAPLKFILRSIGRQAAASLSWCSISSCHELGCPEPHNDSDALSRTTTAITGQEDREAGFLVRFIFWLCAEFLEICIFPVTPLADAGLKCIEKLKRDGMS